MVANEVKIEGQLPLELKFAFCKTFEKITKKLGFVLTFKLNELQDNIFTTKATGINVTLDSLYLYVPIFYSKYSNASFVQ